MPRQRRELIELDDPAPHPSERVYHLRVAGMSFTRIAKLMNLPVTKVANLYQDQLTELARYAPSGDNREGEMALELERLDRIQEAFWDGAIGEDGDPNVSDARMVLEVMKHRAKLKGWESYDPMDTNQLQRVLIIGTSQEAFLDALEAGRRPALASAPRDNEDENSVLGEAGR